MLDISYNTTIIFSQVTDLNNFYKNKLPEIIKIRSLFDNTKLLFNLPGDRIMVMVGQGERIYKLILLSPDVRKDILGWLVYIPLQNRLDIYSQDSPQIPLIQWKNKQAVFKNYSMFLDRAGFDKLFNRLVNTI